jgi:hypothetical protein
VNADGFNEFAGFLRADSGWFTSNLTLLHVAAEPSLFTLQFNATATFLWYRRAENWVHSQLASLLPPGGEARFIRARLSFLQGLGTFRRSFFSAGRAQKSRGFGTKAAEQIKSDDI